MSTPRPRDRLRAIPAPAQPTSSRSATDLPPPLEYESLGNGCFRRRSLPPADEQADRMTFDEIPDEAA